MKKLSLLIFLAFGFIASYGQATFTVDHTLLELPSPNNTAFEQILLTHVKNTSTTPVTFRWTRITECINTGYSTSVCIGGLCFLNTLNTKTFTLEPGGETELSLHLWKDGEGTPGAKAKVTIKEEGNDANIKEVQFVFGVCTSSTFSPELAQSTVFPNPSSDYFKIQTIAPADMIRVVDMQGRTVLTFDYEEGRQYPIQQLATGNYLLMIENSVEKKYGTVQLIKN